jgi:hypothetical protein
MDRGQWGQEVMTPERATKLMVYVDQAIRLLKGLLRYLEQAREEFRLESMNK